MKATGAERALTLAAFAAIALFGAWTRWQSARVEPLKTQPREALVGWQLQDGASVDGLASGGAGGVRLHVPQCAAPAFLFPLRIESVSSASDLDREFDPAQYKLAYVYRGRVQNGWSRTDRFYYYALAAAAALAAGGENVSDRLFAQIYVPTECSLPQSTLVDWANTIVRNWS